MQLSYYRSPKNSSRPKSHNSACNDLLGYLNEQRDGKLLKPEIRIWRNSDWLSVPQNNSDRDRRIAVLKDLLKFQNSQKDKICESIQNLSCQWDRFQVEKSNTNISQEFDDLASEFIQIKDREKSRKYPFPLFIWLNLYLGCKIVEIYKEVVSINSIILQKQREFRNLKAKVEILKLTEADSSFQTILNTLVEHLESHKLKIDINKQGLM